MSTRPDLEVESKKDFFAQINLGLKAEYEFGTGIDCFKFITNELGLNFVKTEDVVSKKQEAVRRTRSKTQKVLNVGNEKYLLNKVKMGSLVSKEEAKIIGICSNKTQSKNVNEFETFDPEIDTSVTKLDSKIEHAPLQNKIQIQLQEITKFKGYFNNNNKDKFEINEPFSEKRIEEETNKNETVKKFVSDSNKKNSISINEINLIEMESENVQNRMELDDIEIINKRIAGETRKNENTVTVKVVPNSNKIKLITINKINLKGIENENVQNSMELDLMEIINKRIAGETRKNENTETVKVVPKPNKIKFITINKINLKGIENENVQNSKELDLMEIINKKIAEQTRKHESNQTVKVVSFSNQKDSIAINEINLKVIENENVQNSIEVDDMEIDNKMEIMNETVKELVSSSNQKDFIAINENNLIEMESKNVQNSMELDDMEIINKRIAGETKKNEITETVKVVPNLNKKKFITINKINLKGIENENVQNSMELDDMEIINKRIAEETRKNESNESVEVVISNQKETIATNEVNLKEIEYENVQKSLEADDMKNDEESVSSSNHKNVIAIKEIDYLVEMESENVQNSIELDDMEIINKENEGETRKNKNIETVKESASESNHKNSMAINDINLKEMESENIKNSKELGDMKNDSKMEFINKIMVGETRKNETVEELETSNSISWETSQRKCVDEEFLIQNIGENDVEIIIDLEENEEQLEEISTRFLCFICQKRFSNKALQRKHIGLHLSNQSKLTTCPFCGKNFFEKKALSQHFTTHLSKKEMINKKCNICQKMFCKTSNVIRHINTIHKKEKENTVFENSVDPNVFNQKEQTNNLSNKMINTKDNESKCLEAIKHLRHKTFKCEMCEVKFTTKNHLQRHKLLHTGQKHFECPVCLKRVSSKYHLKQHLTTHTAPKIYSCKFCFNKYYSLNSFRRHSKEHEKK